MGLEAWSMKLVLASCLNKRIYYRNEHLLGPTSSWRWKSFTGARQHMYGTPVNYVPTPESTKLPNSAAMRDTSNVCTNSVAQGLHIDIVMYIKRTTCCPWERWAPRLVDRHQHEAYKQTQSAIISWSKWRYVILWPAYCQISSLFVTFLAT